jgi:hypothetical protein
MANKMLTAEKLTWSDILAGATPAVRISISRESYATDEPWEPPHLRDKALLDVMFRAIYASPRSDNEEFWAFIDSVHQWYNDRGSLTPKQFQAIRTVYQRIRPA